MSACDALTANAPAGVGPALRAVDCLSNEMAAAAFGRLFGGGGALVPALTILLTLYIAFFAISLLTGRSQISISALTPRMMTLGLVLTFATSWVAYQGVVWNLAIGAPDQIASALMGTRGSATALFADRIDMIFTAIAEVAGAQGNETAASQGAAHSAAAGSFTPGNLMWLGALLLLLGTVGVLVTARIALAVLLALGPVFVIMALFPGTRGLTAGWLRGVVMTAITPLFVVIGGGVMLELLVPIIAALRGAEGVDGRAALALFLIASVHVALMTMVLKVVGSMVSGWQVFGLAAPSDSPARAAADAVPPLASDGAVGAVGMAAPAATPRRSAVMISAASGMASADAASTGNGTGQASAQGRRTFVTQVTGAAPAASPLPRQRARGIGSRFAAQSRQAPREMMR